MQRIETLLESILVHKTANELKPYRFRSTTNFYIIPISTMANQDVTNLALVWSANENFVNRVTADLKKYQLKAVQTVLPR